MIKRITALLTAAALAAAVNVHIYAENTKTVYAAADAVTLGTGFILEPTAVTIPKDASVSEALAAALDAAGIGYDGDMDGGVITYFRSVQSTGAEVHIPQQIMDTLETGWTPYTGTVSDDGFYSEFDYADSSGWMYSVNNASMSVGAADCIPADGDVIRLRFSVANYGGDIGLGVPEYTQYVEGVEFADATELIRLAATSKHSEKYPEAIAVMEKYGASQAEIDAAYTDLKAIIATPEPTAAPTATPTPEPTAAPTATPTPEPTAAPTATPTPEPTAAPTATPTPEPTAAPTATPTPEPTAAPTATPAPADSVYEAYIDAQNTLMSTPFVFGDEWSVIAAARGEYGIADNYEHYNAYYGRVTDAIKSSMTDGGLRLGNGKATEYARTAIALTAIGRDASDIEGYDLFRSLSEYEAVGAQGVNGLIYALLAADTAGYDFPRSNDPVTRERLVSGILALQTESGGWGLESIPDTDVTAMALQALARYTDDEAVMTAVDRGLDFLSARQLESGGFESWGTENSESTAQTLIALCALGTDPDSDERFIKNGMTIPTALTAYAINGGFSHVKGGRKNTIATRQVTCALTAYFRFKRGKTSLYDMSDVRISAAIDEVRDQSVVVYSPIMRTAALIWSIGGEVKHAETELRAGENEIFGTEKAETVYLWNSLSGMRPLCGKYRRNDDSE